MRSHVIQINVGDEPVAGTLASPETTLPGVLFIHGWGGSQEQDMSCSKEIAELGCMCLTFDLRGHAASKAKQRSVTRDDNFRDVLAAYDVLAGQPSVDKSAIAVVGSSYGGYMAALLTRERPIRWLAMRVPALYRDEEWSTAKASLERKDLMKYRNMALPPEDNRALAACAAFQGDALIVESEQDDFVPHQTITNYISAFRAANSVTYRVLKGADHGLSDPSCHRAYDKLLLKWITEMVHAAR
ncbi:alpha/beta hydrolase family protein [Tianweitania sp.]|uniref:alpha/beta hydrolase family protein n=1 Tax=Tianweitania sp. TaxID=2021634 RepID=UPI0028993275|nr:alpha/beta fold hydrolase [Tianweitania sp.]